MQTNRELCNELKKIELKLKKNIYFGIKNIIINKHWVIYIIVF